MRCQLRPICSINLISIILNFQKCLCSDPGFKFQVWWWLFGTKYKIQFRTRYTFRFSTRGTPQFRARFMLHFRHSLSASIRGILVATLAQRIGEAKFRNPNRHIAVMFASETNKLFRKYNSILMLHETKHAMLSSVEALLWSKNSIRIIRTVQEQQNLVQHVENIVQIELSGLIHFTSLRTYLFARAFGLCENCV
jgi:hypothetical protein